LPQGQRSMERVTHLSPYFYATGAFDEYCDSMTTERNCDKY
jgi:hypothetical protein